MFRRPLELQARWGVWIWEVLVNAVIFWDFAQVGLLLQNLPTVLNSHKKDTICFANLTSCSCLPFSH